MVGVSHVSMEYGNIIVLNVRMHMNKIFNVLNTVLKALNWFNVKFDELEENLRFLVFLIFILAPIAMLLTYYEIWTYPFMLFLLLYRVVLPKLARY